MSRRETTPAPRLGGIEGKPPPYDIDAEAGVLAALMFDARHVSAIPAALTPKSFYSEAHARIFEAITDLLAEGTDVAMITVATRLRDSGRIAQVGGIQYITDITTGASSILTPSMFDRLVRSIVNKAALRDASRVLHEALARVYGEPDLQANALLSETERKLQTLSIGSLSRGLKHIAEPIAQELSEWSERADGKGNFGIPSGFYDVDKATAGYHRGDLVILAARPGMGKTAYITASAMHVARRGHATAIFSLEMPARQLAARMLCTEAGLSVIRTRSARMETSELVRAREAQSILRKLDIYIDDAERGRPTVAEICASARRLAADLSRKGRRVGLVVVDYIQIVKLDRELVKQRHELAVGEVSTELKSLAKELDTTVIGVAQLNRGVETRGDKRPGMSDLRDSGQLEQDADMVAMLYRDEYYKPDSRDKGVAELIIEKQRNGPTGTVKLAFDGPTTRFSDLVDDPAERWSAPSVRVPAPPSFYEPEEQA